MASKIGDIVSYNRIRDIRLGLKAPVGMSEYLAICDACGADPVQTLREIITEARRMELEQQTASTKKPAGERFVDDRQSPEAGHEDIDIDTWADRIKAEDKVNVE